MKDGVASTIKLACNKDLTLTTLAWQTLNRIVLKVAMYVQNLDGNKKYQEIKKKKGKMENEKGEKRRYMSHEDSKTEDSFK